jgi:hypothetical protein
MSGGPTTQTPPPDMARGATADLCDVHYPDPVDVVVQPKIQIMQPLFRCRPGQGVVTLAAMAAHIQLVFRDLGGVLRFSGKAATVKCFENNPLVRAVRTA